MRRVPGAAALLAVALAACSGPASPAADPLPAAAADYVRLVGALGRHDADSVEAEGAPGAPAAAEDLPLAQIAGQAGDLAVQLRTLPPAVDADDALRRRHLIEQLDAVAIRAREVAGSNLRDADVERLLGAWVLADPAGEAPGEQATRAALDRLLPGHGPLGARLETFDSRFLVPPPRLEAVFDRALRECRTRTLDHLRLPAGEGVTVRYVTNRPWSGYSRYLGGGHSQIDVNTSLPLTVDRVLELACHEGYPGHHAYNAVRDERLVSGRGWLEFTVLPVFSPEGFAAEAAASMATRLVFTDDERAAFERDVLFPLAGLDHSDVARYLAVARLREQLEPAIASVISGYLSGRLDIIEAGWALADRAAMSQPLATLQFVNRYRGYSLAYTRGKAHVASVLGAGGAGAGALAEPARWRALLRLFEAGAPSDVTRERGDAG